MRKILVVFIAVLLASTPLFAAQKKDNKQRIFTLTVRVIKASKQQKPLVDNKLSDIAKRLQKLVDYNRYQLLDTKTFAINTGEKVDIKLPENRSLHIEFKQFNKQKNIAFLTLSITQTKQKESLLSTDYKVSLGVPLIVGGLKFKQDKTQKKSTVLVLAIELHKQ